MVTLGKPQPVQFRLSWPFIRRGPPILIPKAEKPFWFEKGWRTSADGKQYVGLYTAVGRTWRGLIQEPYPGGYEAYIWHPPLAQIKRNTSHGPCFMANGETGRFQIYFHATPTCLDHAIDSVERVLTEACTGRQ